MLLVSLLFAGGRLPRFVSSWRPWQQHAARAGLCLVPLVFAVTSSIFASQTTTAADPYAI